MTVLALDTSVALPRLMKSHASHDAIVTWLAGRDTALTGHSLAETYSVLTRYPGDARLAPADAARLLEHAFGPPLLLGPTNAASLPRVLAQHGIVGGAVYDALVALAALEHDAELATRDARARATYDAIGARVVAPA